jgi:hypothetical protein
VAQVHSRWRQADRSCLALSGRRGGAGSVNVVAQCGEGQPFLTSFSPYSHH